VKRVDESAMRGFHQFEESPLPAPTQSIPCYKYLPEETSSGRSDPSTADLTAGDQSLFVAVHEAPFQDHIEDLGRKSGLLDNLDVVWE
jgi:hypothetical protein